MGPRSSGTSAPPAPRPRSTPAPTAPTGSRAGSRSELAAAEAAGRHCRRRRRAASPPIATCAASALRRCRSCCGCPPPGGWRACCRCSRSTSSAVSLAIFTALVLKAAVLGHVDASQALEETRRILAFAYLVTALLFARSGLYAERAQRPGLSRIVGALFQVAFVALLFAVVSGEHFSSFYIFWGSLAFALLYVSSLRGAYEWLTGALLRAAGYRRRAVLVGTGRHIRDVAHALVRRAALADRGRRLPFADGAARERPAFAGLARRSSAERARQRTDRRGDHRRPGLPAGRGGRAGRPLPPPRRARAAGAVDDGDPDPPRRVRARPVGAAVRAELAGVRGRRLRAQAHLRRRRRDAAAGAAQPAAAGDRARREAVLARADRVPLDAPRDRAAAVRRA